MTRTDRRAVLVLSAIALLALLALVLLGTDPTTPSDPSSPPTTPSEPYLARPTTPNSSLLTPNSSQRSPFDPNTVDSATLTHLGISPRRVHTFMRYRAAGARFSRPEDITRCYSFSDQDIDLLLPLIRISPEYQKPTTTFTRTKYPLPTKSPSSSPTDPSSPSTSPSEPYLARPTTPNSSLLTPNSSQREAKFTSPTTIDLNTADATLLRRIPGVGEAISSMIINLRDKLGGFTSLSQLSQIHQITPELYDWFTLTDTVPLRKIPINKASFKTLVTHPYISKEQANGILHYIRIYGPIPDSTTLASTALFTPTELTLLTPYLDFHP